MARSEEQKKDLKLKLYILFFLTIVTVPILAVGPFLPKIISKYEKTPTRPESAERMYYLIQIQASTMRAEDAEKNLVIWLTLFADEYSLDFEDVMAGTGEFTMKKYEMGDGLLQEGLTPWLFEDVERPAAVKAADLNMVGMALDLYGRLLEDKKEYKKAAHIFVCLSNMWPQDSEAQLAGEEGFIRCSVRSF